MAGGPSGVSFLCQANDFITVEHEGKFGDVLRPNPLFHYQLSNPARGDAEEFRGLPARAHFPTVKFFEHGHSLTLPASSWRLNKPPSPFESCLQDQKGL
jgi:hypothetical protein